MSHLYAAASLVLLVAALYAFRVAWRNYRQDRGTS